MHRIRNFIQLTENIGTSGQPTTDQFSIIAQDGYKHVINIAMPDHEDAVQNESSIVTSFGMNYLHIPVPFQTPRVEHVRLFCNFLYPIRKDKVFIHCIMNYRVSVFMYHYLSKVEGKEEFDSKSPIFQKWSMEPQWKEALKWSRVEIGL